MQNSTPTAEKMGHLKFSRFIQDCFYDLSDIVLDHGASIYQFVGDEAVITWKVSPRLNFERCIALYFSYKHFLEKRKNDYIELYGFAPSFKCSIHYGTVSAALVGDYKKEIAYHGNVLNLCSRLQVFCKQKDAEVIVSEQFYHRLRNKQGYEFLPVSIAELKGVRGEQRAYYVKEQKVSTSFIL